MYQVRDASTNTIKYTGISRAKVIDNADPYARGFIRVSCPHITESGWIEYLRNPGGYDVPSIGDVVYVQAHSGYVTHLVAWGAYSVSNEAGTAVEVPPPFQRIYPTNRGMFSPKGHLIELDDGLDPNEPSGIGAQGIRISSAGLTSPNKIQLNDQFQNITIEDSAGQSIILQYGANGVVGIQINSENQVNITAVGKTIVSAAEVDIVSGTVNLGDGPLLALANSGLQASFNSHTHSGVTSGTGVSGPPVTPSPSSDLTTNTKAS